MTLDLSLAGRASPAHRAALQRRILWGYALALAVLLADTVTKYAVHTLTPLGWSLPVAPFFNLVHARNPGAAFSFLADAGGWQRLFFIAVALAASVWLAALLRKPLPRLEQLGYSLLLGGALGNGLDRGVRGYVVDFLDFYAGRWHWPAFNIADIGIVCGVVLMLFASWRSPRPAAAA